ncbi:YidH family protein [Nocardia salmonicida]|uniref:YidH family protein n=1 Tax=Nocardia salmonicida TaxID=53431 RepID=UPI0033F47A0E
MSDALDTDPDREPDYRFTLANERTFLAWIRTALGLLAGGVAVGQFYSAGTDPVVHKAIGAVCAVLACLIAVGAFLQWRRVQAAMRRDAPLPRPPLVTLTLTGVCLAAALSVALVAV